MDKVLKVLSFLANNWELLLLVAVFFLRKLGVAEGKIKAVQRAGQLAEVYVGSAEAAVRELKNPLTDGAFTPDQAAAIKADVLKRLHAALAADLPELQKAIGATPVREFLDDLVESKVTVLRTLKPAAQSSAALVRTTVVEDAASDTTTTTTTAAVSSAGTPQAVAPLAVAPLTLTPAAPAAPTPADPTGAPR